MLQLAGGGAKRTIYTELARIWKVSYPQIIKCRQKIDKNDPGEELKTALIKYQK